MTSLEFLHKLANTAPMAMVVSSADIFSALATAPVSYTHLNGCIGTVDVSYPSIPIFLKYCPELVNALCRPVLEFASMPVWTEDFAPHDVGRYPLATGQVYAARRHVGQGECYPPYYLYRCV